MTNKRLNQILGSLFSLNPNILIDKIKDDSLLWTDFHNLISDMSRNKIDKEEFLIYNDETVNEYYQIANKKFKPKFNEGNANPFEFLRCAANVLIDYKGESPKVNINKMQIWQDLTMKMGEDIFVAASYANNNLLYGHEPLHFQWNYILSSNFERLNDMINEKGLYENHYHLWGSAPNVDLSWLSLMNNPFGRASCFDNMNNRKAMEVQGISILSSYKQASIYVLTQIAAYIRLTLFEICCLQDEDNVLSVPALIKFIKNAIECDTIIENREMEDKINVHKFHSQFKSADKVVDYAINQFIFHKNIENCAISGERHLYYRCLQQIFQNNSKSYDIYVSFYIYLIIKNFFAGQFFQRNKKYGFDNFQKYQKIKSDFISGSIYEPIALKMAINENISKNSIRKLEVRVAPRNDSDTLKTYIDYIEKMHVINSVDDVENNYLNNLLNVEKDELKKSQTPNFFYNIHFIKSKTADWGIQENFQQMRDSKLRRSIKKQALAILLLRERNEATAYRIGGIDASSSEVNCRPEVFSQAFRLLTSHVNKNDLSKLDTHKLPTLKKTYHVGEDFYDLADGLRAIDEAIWFLDLKHGDRIGHGVALGLNPEQYYYKRKEIAMPVQNILDNFAWISYCVSRFNLNVKASYLSEINFQFDKYLNKVFNANNCQLKVNCDLYDYIDAWKLRGDNPIAYIRDYSDETINGNLIPFTSWAIYDFRAVDSYKNIRESTYQLYHKYHYDNQVKRNASKSEIFYVKPEYVEIVSQIQSHMRNFVLESGVGIESCPSSNYSISQLNDYKELPAINLFPIEESEGFLRLFTSINTDDQGIFYTSLVKEYTLLVNIMQSICSEKGIRKYSDDTILNWIEKLINNGREQCFMK